MRPMNLNATFVMISTGGLNHPEWSPCIYYKSIINHSLQYIRLHATERGETLVDRHKGLDSYLLETPVNEVYAMGLLRSVGFYLRA